MKNKNIFNLLNTIKISESLKKSESNYNLNFTFLKKKKNIF
jgi:hypothetical protein